MNWEVFAKAKHCHPRETHPFISIIDATRICFSLPCAEWFAANDIRFVEYLWDKESRAVAFRSSVQNGYTLQIRGGQAYVSARLFLQHIGSPRGRFTAVINEKEKMIEASLRVEERG